MNFKITYSRIVLALIFVGFSLTAPIVGNESSSLAEGFNLKNSTQMWDALLKKHLKAKGAVDYQGFQKDQNELKKFIESYKNLTENTLKSDAEKTAAYINLYNASMINNLLKYAKSKNFDPSSAQFTKLMIKEIKVPGGNIWNGDYKVSLGKHSVNLDGIEHGLIRGKADDNMKKFKVSKLDPRIHSAVNCAALSCPPIRSDAYTADNLDGFLTENMKSWLSDNNQFSKSGSALKANSIVHWYYSDFDDYAQKTLKVGGAGDYLSTFISKDAKDAAWKIKHLKENFNDRSFLSLKLSSDFSFDYNWLINDVRNFKGASK